MNLKFKDSELLAEAVMRGDSRLNDIRRGTGLPKLGDFIKRSNSWGLQVFSGKGLLILKKKGSNKDVEIIKEDIGVNFQGTLIFLEMERQ